MTLNEEGFLIFNYVGFNQMYIRNPKREDGYLDIMDRLSLISKPAMQLFIGMKNCKTSKHNQVILDLKNRSKAVKARYYRNLTELIKAGLIIEVKNTPGVVYNVLPYSYILNPFLINPLDDTSFTLWRDLGGEAPKKEEWA